MHDAPPRGALAASSKLPHPGLPPPSDSRSRASRSSTTRAKATAIAENLHDVYYNTAGDLVDATEGARLAIKKDGWPLTPQNIKDGLETPRTMTPMDLWPRLPSPRRITAEAARPASRCGTAEKWVPQADWGAAFKDEVWSVVKAQSADYAESELQK